MFRIATFILLLLTQAICADKSLSPISEPKGNLDLQAAVSRLQSLLPPRNYIVSKSCAPSTNYPNGYLYAGIKMITPFVSSDNIQREVESILSEKNAKPLSDRSEFPKHTFTQTQSWDTHGTITYKDEKGNTQTKICTTHSDIFTNVKGQLVMQSHNTTGQYTVAFLEEITENTLVIEGIRNSSARENAPWKFTLQRIEEGKYKVNQWYRKNANEDWIKRTEEQWSWLPLPLPDKLR